MIRNENTNVYGWEVAIRGMRNPMNSWEKSEGITLAWDFDKNMCIPKIGENDLKLMKNLSKAGSDHGKFLRMITVTVDITAPLYWWKEFDTYKVGTVANSCSTMHKIHAKEFTLDDFSHEHLYNIEECPIHIQFDRSKGILNSCPAGCLDIVIGVLNGMREKFLETKEKAYWWQMIQLLPSSYNQRRTVQLNYQVLKSMYFARKNHKLDEWHDFCLWAEGLPYFKEIVIAGDD